MRNGSGGQAPQRVCFVSGIVDRAASMQQLKALRDDHGFEVAAVIASAEGGMGRQLREWGIAYHVRPLDLGREFAQIRASIVELAALFRRERFDVVQSQDFNAMLLARVAAWVADVPVRVTRVIAPFHLEAPLSRQLDRMSCFMDTLFLGVNFTLDQYRVMGVPEHRLGWISSAIDGTVFDPNVPGAGLRPQFGFSPEARLIGLVGHFYPRSKAGPWSPALAHGRCAKGHEDFLRAASLVLAKAPDVRFVLLGRGFGEEGALHLEEMKSLVIALGLEGRVVFAGARHDMPAVLRDLDICAQPSVTENLACATMEAMLMEKPMVASRTGGLVDVVEDGVTGLLVPPADPTALARAILRLLENPRDAAAMGRAGRLRIRAMASERQTAERLADHYRGQMARSWGRHRAVISALRRRVADAWLRLGGAWIVQSTLAFSHPPKDVLDRLRLSLLAADFPGWGPRLLGMDRYRRWATGRLGLLTPDGSLALSGRASDA